MKRLLLAALVVLLPAVAHAQTPASSYVLKFYNVGAPSPIQTETFAASTALCGQTKPAATSTVNPTRFFWDDPAGGGKVCILGESASGPLFSIPLGNYEGTVAAVNATASSAESNRAPFSRDAALPAPSNFAIVR